MEDFWTSLKCIRCGACMNTCPVYRRSGGLSYGAVYSGPIGAIIDPTFNERNYLAPIHISEPTRIRRISYAVVCLKKKKKKKKGLVAAAERS